MREWDILKTAFRIQYFHYEFVVMYLGLTSTFITGNLSPCYVGTYLILRCFDEVVYELYLPSNLASGGSVFYDSL